MILWLRFPWQKARFWVQAYGVSVFGKWFAVYVPKTEIRTGYMCSVDFDHELGMAKGGNQVFATPEDVQAHLKCVSTECGIYEVEIKFRSVVVEERWDKKKDQ